MRAARIAGQGPPRGNVAIEFALVLPALLLLILGIADVARVIWTQTTLDRAVEAAARCAAVDATDCGTAALVQSYAAGQAFGLAIASSAFTVTAPACGTQVAVSMPFTLIIPWLATSNITLAATACYPT